ncbi:MAG: class I SAM-dependent methyltransferase [bacterium]
MFTKSAKFYDAIYHFKDYKAASEKLIETIKQYNPDAVTLLDTACGTGKHIEYLKGYFDAEGLDMNPELLEIARERCPGNLFHESDMIDFKLNKNYDVVTCLFSSIAYVKTLVNLNKAISSMSEHLNMHGLLIIEPWFSKENFWTDHITANYYDEKDLKISWMYTSVRENDISILDINYLVGTPSFVTHFKELHELGLFNELQYRQAFIDAGLEVKYDKEGLFGRGMYIGIKS